MKQSSDKWQVTGDKMAAMRESRSCHLSRVTCHAFTLVEVMVVMTLLSLIVLVLMAVFNSTQAAFRASVTQADVLEAGRATMDLMASDLKQMSPSGGINNTAVGAANFYANTNINEHPLVQSLVASSQQRTNVLENFFILSRGNQNGVPTWFAVGYAVTPISASGSLYPLYRFATNHPAAAVDPAFIFTNDFRNFLANVAGGSHLMDGVVSLTVRAYDINGGLMTGNVIVSGGQATTNRNVYYLPSTLGQTGFYMFSNTLPASVEIELGALEDRILQRAGSLPNNLPSPPPNDRQTMYLQGQAGAVHIFRQRVSIPNVDPSAYQ
jgi:prepilin-type N-terminal cleavage/methylation domain-containing protein